MKNLLFIAFLCVLAACSKNEKTEPVAPSTSQATPEICDFGKTEFNLSKRAPLNEEYTGKKPQSGGGTGGGTGGGGTVYPPAGSNPGVILVDFNGQQVSGTSWNTMGIINCAPANLSAVAMESIIDRVENDFSPFYITVTTDEAVYNAANPARRMRVIVTESWEWFGQAGGASLTGSFTWGNNTPCFVFSSLLGYNEKQIAEATSHEAGHTFGLKHQASYSGTTLINQYNYGQGAGEIGWAPIMGCSYYSNMSTWHNGPTSVDYNAYQDDVAIITGVVGVKPDDYSNSTAAATVLSSSRTGTIHSGSDVDFFSVSLPYARTLTAVPFNTGTGNTGANLDLVVKIYSASGQLLNTINDPLILNAGLSLNAGNYYVSVSVASNQYATTYGQLSQYSIELN